MAADAIGPNRRASSRWFQVAHRCRSDSGPLPHRPEPRLSASRARVMEPALSRMPSCALFGVVSGYLWRWAGSRGRDPRSPRGGVRNTRASDGVVGGVSICRFPLVGRSKTGAPIAERDRGRHGLKPRRQGVRIQPPLTGPDTSAFGNCWSPCCRRRTTVEARRRELRCRSAQVRSASDQRRSSAAATRRGSAWWEVLMWWMPSYRSTMQRGSTRWSRSAIASQRSLLRLP